VSGNFGARRAARRGGVGRAGGAGDVEGVADVGAGPADAAIDPPADPESVARKIALDLLTAAPRTRAQLAEAMARRGVPDDAAAAVLERFGEVGLIDDAAFAAAWVASRHAGRGLAPRALAGELRQRGVAEPLIAEAVAAVSRDDMEATARSLARRKARATAGLAVDVRLRRLAGMLARKGYPGDVALRAVRDVLAQEAQEAEEAVDLSEHTETADL
jgi:regulatory protein